MWTPKDDERLKKEGLSNDEIMNWVIDLNRSLSKKDKQSIIKLIDNSGIRMYVSNFE